jgi:hypothetical protein
MDGVTGSAEVEVEQRGLGEAGMEEERCVTKSHYKLSMTISSKLAKCTTL